MKDDLRGVIVRHGLSVAEREEVITRLAGTLAGEGAVLFAYLFGTFVEEGPFGDIDVAVFLDERCCDPGDFLAATLRLAGVLEHMAGLPVDVAVLNGAPLGLRMAAVRGRLILSRDEAARLSFVEQTSLQAMDTAYLRSRSLHDLLQP